MSGFCCVEFCNRRVGSSHLPLCGLHLVFRAHRKKKGFCNCPVCERTIYEATRLHIPEHEILKSSEPPPIKPNLSLFGEKK